jgi:hypothetical protein
VCDIDTSDRRRCYNLPAVLLLSPGGPATPYWRCCYTLLAALLQPAANVASVARRSWYYRPAALLPRLIGQSTRGRAALLRPFGHGLLQG